MTYEFILKNEKAKYYKAIQYLFIIFNLLAFVYMAYKTNNSNDKKILFLFVAVNGLYLLYALFQKISNKQVPAKLYIVLLLWNAIGWGKTGLWWVNFILLLFLLLDRLANRKLLLVVTEKIIEYPSFPAKQIKWDELTNLVLKDGLITIDFKNNKIIQQVILNTDISEKEFNEFCRIQLNKERLLRDNGLETTGI